MEARVNLQGIGCKRNPPPWVFKDEDYIETPDFVVSIRAEGLLEAGN